MLNFWSSSFYGGRRERCTIFFSSRYPVSTFNVSRLEAGLWTVTRRKILERQAKITPSAKGDQRGRSEPKGREETRMLPFSTVVRANSGKERIKGSRRGSERRWNVLIHPLYPTASPGSQDRMGPQNEELCVVLRTTDLFVCAQSFSRVRLCDPMDCSPPGPSVHEIP